MQKPLSLHVRVRREDGLALIVALMAMMLLMALGLTLVMTTTTETKISANYSQGTEALYAADAAVERVMDDILTVPDWNEILQGNVRSAFVDGSPSGVRTLPDGSQLDLDKATNMLDCGKVDGCSDEELNTFTDDRPWGLNNPRWQLYAYGPISDMLPTDTINSKDYVVVWIADDPSETDNDPTMDGQPGVNCGAGNDPGCDANPGLGVLAMHAEAYGPFGAKRVIEVTIARTDTTEIERGYTGQRGQDEQNRRARKAAVQTPGKALTQKELSLTTGTIQ
ncbi:MAG TPA: PilX N-terminal domain-containing pilus assembly protein [Vicinamibacterales bacterium]|jgi:hypothetical protein|nr:PilX N-terminal domain-containing pilus assembly protein [Vicinamibacterales bacterium]